MRQEFVEVSTIEAAYTACPWAAEIVEVEGGFQAFESMTDYSNWVKNTDQETEEESEDVAQHQQFSVQWEFMGSSTQEHFDAAQAVADAMETLGTIETTKDVLAKACHILGRDWDPKSVQAVVENCSFERIDSNTKDKNMMAPAPEITRKALDAGKIVHTGWTPNRDTADQCGVNVSDYFDLTGKFLGPDENGLAPTFKRA